MLKSYEISKISNFVNNELKHHYPPLKNYNITCKLINDEHINSCTCERKIFLYTNDFVEEPLEFDKDTFLFSGYLIGVYNYEYYDNNILKNKCDPNKKVFYRKVCFLDDNESKRFFKTIEKIINWIPFSGHNHYIPSDDEF